MSAELERKRIFTITDSKYCSSSPENLHSSYKQPQEIKQTTIIENVSLSKPDFIPNEDMELLASTLSSKTGYSDTIPVDAIDIANKLGYKVFEIQFITENISGVINKEEKTITINENDGIKRKLAHELGHLLLGHGQLIDYRLYVTSYDKHEYQANLFASMLIMPKENIIKAWKKYKNIDKVAKKI